jgi:F420-non-reducing hydrogenase small subunit
MPHLIADTVESLVKEEKPKRYNRVVCNECPRKILPIKPAHLVKIYERESDPAICLLNQGFVCLGSLTRNGCRAPCPQVGFTCFGCRGPSDPLFYRSKDLYNVLVDIVSRRTGIEVDVVRAELYTNPFIFHTFIFSNKVERFKAMERVV